MTPNPPASLSPQEPIRDVLVRLVRHPHLTLVRRWNWKTAALSALTRGALFFGVTLHSGVAPALLAASVDMPFRLGLAGLTGALVQHLRFAQPRWASTFVVAVIVPVVGHVGEILIHWSAATPRLGIAVLGSFALTVVTTTMDLWAMRRGWLIVGPQSRPLSTDVRDLMASIGRLVNVRRAFARGASSPASPESSRSERC